MIGALGLGLVARPSIEVLGFPGATGMTTAPVPDGDEPNSIDFLCRCAMDRTASSSPNESRLLRKLDGEIGRRVRAWLEARRSVVLITRPISGRLEEVSLSVSESEPLVL